MGDLNSALDAAFDSERAAMDSGAAQSASEPEPSTPDAGEAEPEAAEPEAESVEAKADSAIDGTGAPLTPQEVAELKQNNPKAYETYRRMAKSLTTTAQERAELRRQNEQLQRYAEIFQAIQNPQTKEQALNALVRSLGMELKPSDLPQREAAAQIAGQLEKDWDETFGPDAARMMRPLFERLVQHTMQQQMAPMQAMYDAVQQRFQQMEAEARGQQSQGHIAQFKAGLEKKGLPYTPEIEQKMGQVASQIAPIERDPITGEVRPRPFASDEEALRFLDNCYRLARADEYERDIQKQFYERTQKAISTAEPTRGVPSTGREKRTSVTKDMNFSDAWDTAIKESARELGWK